MRPALLYVAMSLLLLPFTTQASTVLPFDVSLGGEKAVLQKPDAIFATVTTPVAPDAALEVHAESQMVIINVFPCDASGNPLDGATPAIILLQGKTTGSLADTMDKAPLKPGTYVANVVCNSKTSRVFFTVK